MVIDLRRCAESAVHVERVFDVSEFPGSDPEVAKLDSIRLTLDVARAGERRFVASGTFESKVSATCVRCLEPVAAPIAGSFRVIYLPDPGAVPEGPGESELDTASVDVSYYKDDKLEVMPLLSEQVHLALPMRFLCKEECLGLCSQCGVNRNLTECRCQPTPKSSAFESLRDLLN